MGKQEDNTTLDILEQTEVILDGECSFWGLLEVLSLPVHLLSAEGRLAAVEMHMLR